MFERGSISIEHTINQILVPRAHFTRQKLHDLSKKKYDFKHRSDKNKKN